MIFFFFFHTWYFKLLLCQSHRAMCWLTFTAKASSNSVQAAPPQKSIIHSLGPPKRPEEDILFQWRLRRKMEQAREWPQALKHSSPTDPAFSWQAPSLSVPSAGGQAHKVGVHDIYSSWFNILNIYLYSIYIHVYLYLMYIHIYSRFTYSF